ncbi:hypothetical protein Cadr_000008761, partial [Camelus dromedarius]
PPRHPASLGPPGPDWFRSAPLATSRAAGAPARGSALAAGGGGARTHARMSQLGRRNCPERGEAGRSCSGSRGRRRSGDWAAACCRLHCCRRAGKGALLVPGFGEANAAPGGRRAPDGPGSTSDQPSGHGLLPGG